MGKAKINVDSGITTVQKIQPGEKKMAKTRKTQTPVKKTRKTSPAKVLPPLEEPTKEVTVEEIIPAELMEIEEEKEKPRAKTLAELLADMESI